jgi:hypothetical protein
MNTIKVKEMILKLRHNGIHLEDIENELSYRDNGCDYRWNNDLHDYSTEILADIEQLWCEI